MNETNYAKLRGRITEVCGTQERFARAIGLTPTSVSYKLNGKRDWTQGEIRKTILVLNIPYDALYEYFFAPTVKNT